MNCWATTTSADCDADRVLRDLAPILICVRQQHDPIQAASSPMMLLRDDTHITGDDTHHANPTGVP